MPIHNQVRSVVILAHDQRRQDANLADGQDQPVVLPAAVKAPAGMIRVRPTVSCASGNSISVDGYGGMLMLGKRSTPCHASRQGVNTNLAPCESVAHTIGANSAFPNVRNMA